ncbi:uncharacterized protein F5891DRAFT_638969 [Suillus fuscotomentosus]|uniref:LIM zinc-binding domain-containing protein n=1 Tax=Suillus fuscotomentosus TaxID=1912939 RepID=A0AAD4EH59_9AGAM|nr:uncharacterized protein F5891DRAFT_638969 [Suillus fuscotomentosus]KAG1906050.1 hypothetical protein F5891DRAFT_638969 [Suillus fuscotomentosus]
MEQIASNSPKQPPRISQLLPTVKCSSCLQPVPLADLGDHVCSPQPPFTLPSLQKPPMSPKSTNSLLPQRLQNILVSNRAGALQQQQPVTSRTPPPHAHPSKSSQHDPFQRIPPTVHYNQGATRINSPASPPIPQSILLNGGTSTNKPHVRFPTQSAPERATAPIRIATPPVTTRIHTPSNKGSPSSRSPLSVSSFPNPFEDDPRQSGASERTASPARRENLPVAPHAPPPSSRTRTPSNAPSYTSIIPPSLAPRPSYDRSRTSSTLTPRPSLDKPRPSFDTPRPSFDTQRPSFDVSRSHHPADVRPQPGSVPRPPHSTSTLPPPGGVPFPSSAPTPQPPPATHSPVPDSERNIDTKCGGEAGMAGVGRRGFAAVTRAAMVAASHSQLDSRRANAPKYLDLNTAMNHVMRAAMTPPLSPNSGYSHSPVSPHPVSPLSLHNTTPTTGQFPKTPLTPHDKAGIQLLSSSPNQKPAPLSSSPADIHIVTPSRSPSPISNPFSRHLSGETVNQSPFAAVPVRLPFLDAFDKGPVKHSCDDSDDESVYTTHTAEPGRGHRGGTEPMSPSTDSDVGLAYADDSDNDTPVVMPLDIRKSNAVSGINKVQFPSIEDRHQSFTVQKPPSRKASASSAPTASTSRTIDAGASRTRSASAATHTTTRSAGALERAMETLIEEGASVSILASGSVLASMAGPSGSRASGKPIRSNTVPGPVSPESRPPKLPARSYTSPHHPHIHSEPVGITGQVARVRERSNTKKDRICASCDTKVDDGRWIQMDGGNILCERCWKNMYLPKCRRCNLPIEKQAVSSSDGQLKGKYHKNCFNCHVCQKPFPDKEFYVFDGKPLCAYHYHEANDSLCAAASCGQPIEGPCAVTHAGKRYHPDHLLCEFENGCGERLAEYWEVDGQMLCEKHAALAGCSSCASSRGDSPDPQRIRDEGRARRRMTRFIDLGAVEEEDVDIR